MDVCLLAPVSAIVFQRSIGNGTVKSKVLLTTLVLIGASGL